MPSSISKLKALVDNYGAASAARYVARFNLPAVMKTALPNIGNIDNLSIVCSGAVLPGRVFNTTPHIIYGTTIKMPYGVLYNDLVLNINCSDDMGERYFFDAWHHYVSDQNTNYFNYYDDYAGSITVDKYSMDDQKVYSVTCEDAFPIIIEDQPLSYESERVLTLTVHFAYRKWRSLDEAVVSGNNDTSNK